MERGEREARIASIFTGDLSNIATIVANITLFAVLIYELFGPMLTKIALIKAGEIDLKPVKLKHDHIVSNDQRPKERHERRKQIQN